MTIILYAIPMFFILIGIELIMEKRRNTTYYRVNDTISSLSAGVLSRMIGIFRNLVPFTLYIITYENVSLLNLPESPWVWVLAFILYDFFYYWNHRFGHEVSLFWASHVVHHSSENYNLSTALRQSSGGFFTFIFYLPMALLGFSPIILITVGSLNLVYQFWVHTQHIGKLGCIEWLMVTPSNHRVHHAQNQVYLDRNYGGVFIIWDRIFGSFQEELDEEKPIYGVRKALNSWNPFWANLQVYSQLLKDSWRTHRWSDKVRVWFGKTGWRPNDVSTLYPIAPVDLASFTPYHTQLTRPAKIYVILQYILSSIIGVYLLMNAANMAIIMQLSIASYVIASSVNLAWIMENRSYSIYLEWLKCIGTIMASLLLTLPNWLAFILCAGTLLSIVVLFSVKRNQSQEVASQI